MLSQPLVVSFIDDHGTWISCRPVNLVNFANSHQRGKQQILLPDIYVIFWEYRFHKTVIVGGDYAGDMTGRFT